jgi:hypothetical protein
MASKIEGYTVDNLARTADHAVISEAIGDLRTAFRGMRNKQGTVMIAAAYATVASVENKVKARAELAREWGGIGEPMNASTITLYYRLGLAARDLDILPGGVEFTTGNPVWTLLGGKGGATISAVGMFLEKGPVVGYTSEGKPEYHENGRDARTVADLIDLLGDYFNADGSKVDPKTRKTNEARRMANIKGEEFTEDTADTDNGGGSDDGGDLLTGTRTLDQRLNTAIENVIALMAQVSEESVFVGVKPNLDRMWETIDAAQAQFAEAPAKAKRTRKTA